MIHPYSRSSGLMPTREIEGRSHDSPLQPFVSVLPDTKIHHIPDPLHVLPSQHLKSVETCLSPDVTCSVAHYARARDHVMGHCQWELSV
jgi:hypothetical protein